MPEDPGAELDASDLARLRELRDLFDRPELAGLWAPVRDRLERLGRVAGTVVLADPGDEERLAIAGLLGLPRPPRGPSRIPLARLDRALRESKADPELKDLAAALANGRLQKLAIANPEHAPYGRAAREALQHAGLWDKIQGKLVFGENVAQATQFATSGAAQGGIIPLSLSRSPAMASLGSFALLPDSWHKPLRQRTVLLQKAGETARAFYAYMRQPAARAVLARYGFVLP